MNTNLPTHQPENEIRRFLSMVAFRESHSELLHKHHTSGDSPDFLGEVQEFIHAGKILGELLDGSDDRWATQSILDYWATVLFRAQYDPLDVTLADFNPDLAPDLDASLCPYLGLDAFQENDHTKFFGRSKAVDHLLVKIRESRLVCVVGSSGSGKSSLVRAGLLPALKRGEVDGSQGWNYYSPFVPGSNPLVNLIDAICPPKTDRETWISKQVKAFQENPGQLRRLIAEIGLDLPTVLVIDQFEEVFTLCTDESLRHAFINNLSEFVTSGNIRHTVVLTMRTDFQEHLTQFPSFDALSPSSMFIMQWPTPLELREAIEGPANLIMLKFEDNVVDDLIEDVRNDQTPLPLLQFALLKLWESKQRNRITRQAYKELEGAHGALPTSAERLYSQLSNEDKLALRYILVKLSRQPSKGQEVTRNRISLKGLFEDGIARNRIEWVLDKLIASHLVRLTKGDTVEETLVEIAHEALVRNWRPLVEWLDEDRSMIRRRENLNEAAFFWEANGRDPNLLWRGFRREEASSYKDLSPTEEIFLATSKEVEDAEREHEIAQRVALDTAQFVAQTERENREKFQILNAELEKALAQAEIERDRAERQARLASSRELAVAANNNLTVDPERSILLAMHAVSLTYSAGDGVAPEAEESLHRAIHGSRLLLALSRHTDQVRGVAFSPDGEHIATASHDNTVKIWHARSGEELFTLLGHDEGVLDVAFSPSGTYLASASRDGTAQIWLAKTGELVQVFRQENEILGVAFSPDERLLATGCEDHVAILWNIASGKIVHVLEDHRGGINRIVFSPDGTRLATASRDRTVGIWDVRSGEWLARLVDEELDDQCAHESEVIDVAFSPDGNYLVTSGRDSVKVWRNEPRNRKVMRILKGHKSWVESLAFSPDGKCLATGSQDGTAKIWLFTPDDLEAGRELFTLAGHTDRIYKVAFSPDGNILATAGRDGVARVWNISLSQEVFSVRGHEKEITSISYNPDGNLFVTTSQDNTAKIWDVRAQQVLYSLAGHTQPVLRASFSPDGKCMATVGLDSQIIIWDTSSGNALHRLNSYRDHIFDIAFSLAGDTLAAACKDGRVRIWDTASFALVDEIIHPDMVYRIAFRPPDSHYIATVSEDRIVRVWNRVSREQVTISKRHVSVVSCLAFSPDGSYLATGSYDRSILIMDPNDGHVLQTLSGHTQGVVDLSFSPNGKKLAAAGDDGTVRVWDVESGQEVLVLANQLSKLKAVSFSPDGRQLVSASQDGMICVYAFAIEDLLELAQRRVTRSLRPDECQKYLRTAECPPAVSGADNTRATALWYIVHGRNLARGGDLSGAIVSFQKAQGLEPNLVNFEPEAEAQRLASSIFRK